jgi:bifunctional DNA-binding transcriptional regulator/antitoxin component of YhaV-PrlF toxin-antitoxin module
MTTVLSQKDEVVLPMSMRQGPRLSAGDDFEVAIKDENTIILRRVSRPANHGLGDLLLSCPSSFTIPPRETDDSQPHRF